MEEANIMPHPIPASRKGPLPPIQTKRRMSASWTDNLEPVVDLKSPELLKSPEPKPSGSRSSSDSDPVKEPPVKEEKSERKSSRRESLKDQLIKFKMKAEKTVERKRGSVHLAKRLQRRLTIHQEEGPTEGEMKSVDEQIEHSLKIGARFLQEQKSLYPPDETQYAFFVEDYEKEQHQPPAPATGQLLDYKRAEMVSDVDPNLVYYEQRPLDVESNNGQIILSRMTQRLSDKFFTNGKLRRIDESLFVKPSKAEPWEAFVDEIRGSEYVQLDVFLDSTFFEQHPLANDEYKLHVRFVSLYDEQCGRINEMTDALMDAENAPTSITIQIVSEPKSITATIVEKFGTTKKTLAKVNIPLPTNDDSGHSPVRIPFTNSENTANGFISAYSSWSTEARTRRRESAAPVTTTNDEPFSIIPVGVRLVSDEEFDSNPRWIALEKRSRKRNATGRIPIDGSDIDVPPVVTGDDRRHKGSFRTAVDGVRAAGLANAVKLRTKLLDRDQDAAELSYSEIVREEPLPGLFGAIGSLFGPADLSRKLKPMRRVPVRQQSSVRCTPAVPGRNPSWQHSLSLPVNGADDPKSIIDCIRLNVYDQIVNSLDKDDRLVNTVHEQLVRRLIGWVEIPFSTVYSKVKVDGWLRIQRPVFYSGYSMPDRPSYVKVLIAFDPPMVPPRITAPRRLGSIESDKTVSQCETWSKACSAMFESRRYTALVTDINGKAVLACRFLGPVSPPHSVPHPSTNPRQTVEVAARLVSMVPFITDPVLFPGSTDLWTTVEKFLSLGCGDEEEHALLLCCWLLSYGISCCLVLGFSLPEGARAAYALVNLPDGIVLVNPCDGSIYASTDAMCPMTSVGTIITPSNVYGNVQNNAHPSQLQFDLYVTRSTISLFPDRTNRNSFRLLREILQDEQRSVDDRLLRLRESYAVTLCTITIPYRDIKDCVAAVLRCGLHTTTSASPQFALAVHLQSVFGHVISCSIAIALLTLKR
ncbi:hypothetical protein GCK32_003158 [Trichostrongylus colubriformis]|uniref:CEP76/DRC7 peptidase-like domain-containing protein n=1 Tax=Trichostrongylus colubriformis TaxID=6319 RepID=A0AAN8GC61_TRICO